MNKLILLIFSAVILGGCNRIDNHSPLGSKNLDMALVGKFSQSFVSHRENLNIVYICLRNPSRLLTPLRFILTDPVGNSLRTIDFNGGNIDNSDCTRFQFDPIQDSRDQSYIASIEPILPPNATPKQIEGAISGIYVETDSGVLHYKTLYQQDFRSVVIESLDQFSQRLGLDKWFLIPFVATLITLIYLWNKAHA